MYSPQLLNHFEHPRNRGELPEADVVAEVQNPTCGDVLRLSMKFVDGRIDQVRFLSKGCVPTMACGSALTELILGKTNAEASEITAAQLADLLGGMPAHSLHGAQLAIDCLQTALKKAGAKE